MARRRGGVSSERGVHTLPNEDFPLRVDGVTAGWAAERRPEDVIPAARTDAWQLVYVRSGTIEERCDDRRVLLRAGGLLFHQPAETFGMAPGGRGAARCAAPGFFVYPGRDGPLSRCRFPCRTPGTA